MQCSNCHADVLESDRFCEQCGTRLEAAIRCEKCGGSIDAEGYCHDCGLRQQERSQTVLSAQFAGVSDRGLRHHRNEDAFAIDQKNQTSILVVCDGVSSSHDSHLAAEVAAEIVCHELGKHHPAPNIALKTAIDKAQTAVSQLADSSDPDPPSTTIVAAIVQEQTATIAWLGDSRAYWISKTEARLLTQDDSWINQAIASGELTQTEASQSPNAHAITRWLGKDASGFECSIVTFTSPSSGYLLLCTDGLWNYTPTVEALFTLMRPRFGQSAIDIVHALTDDAIQQGGHDNITIALLAV